MSTLTAHQPIPTVSFPSPSSSSNQTPTSPANDSAQTSPSSRGYWDSSNVSRQSKQIYNQRVPLYVPAVLRPTEKPLKASPPHTLHSATRSDSPASSQHQQSDGAQSDIPHLKRMVTEEWLETSMGKVSGPPSRNHWKTDASSQTCDSADCDRTFSLLSRRHHCRRCGSIFCGDHSPHDVPLDQHARFHPRAQRYRACDDCFRDYRVWETERLRKAKHAAQTPVVSPIFEGPIDVIAKPSDSKDNGFVNTLAQSVPSNWNWSTF